MEKKKRQIHLERQHWTVKAWRQGKWDLRNGSVWSQKTWRRSLQETFPQISGAECRGIQGFAQDKRALEWKIRDKIPLFVKEDLSGCWCLKFFRMPSGFWCHTSPQSRNFPNRNFPMLMERFYVTFPVGISNHVQLQYWNEASGTENWIFIFFIISWSKSNDPHINNG